MQLLIYYNIIKLIVQYLKKKILKISIFGKEIQRSVMDVYLFGQKNLISFKETSFHYWYFYIRNI